VGVVLPQGGSKYVNQDGGYIWVYSEVGGGTTFKIYLPRVQDVVEARKENESYDRGWEGTETVLVAEDSAGLREMVSEYVGSLGYMVLTAASGKDALRRAQETAAPIDLLLSDVIMPEMSGPELAEQIKKVRPGIKIIFTSVYTDDAIALQGGLDPAVAFLQKPYSPKALARKIR
jgi:CheY-like chemotaxis protein